MIRRNGIRSGGWSRVASFIAGAAAAAIPLTFAADAPAAAELSLREEGYARDKDSYSQAAFPAFHGYGASGKASGQVVYVNHGTHEDFERLDSLGVSVEGRIALVRYGKVFRGLKVKEA